MDGEYVVSERTPVSDLLNEEAVTIVTGVVVGEDESWKKIGVEALARLPAHAYRERPNSVLGSC
ncbi:hypothetical protein DMJ13_23185 [halophilic archaeon]|nr:hypothetical protein DMJ13_23185 [halophilic archaeon]